MRRRLCTSVYCRAKRRPLDQIIHQHLRLSPVNNLGLVYKDQGRLNEAESMYNHALQGTEKSLGSDNAATFSIIVNLGNLYRCQGRLKEAEAMLDHALQGQEKVHRPDSISTLETVGGLANLYRDQGRLQEAEAIYERALHGYEMATEENINPGLESLRNMQDFARFRAQQGQKHTARSLYIRCREGFGGCIWH